jgi:hypothetical protein
MNGPVEPRETTHRHRRCEDAAVDVTHRYGQAVDEAWLAAATAEAVSEGSVEVRDAVERMDALLRAWAVGFRARRTDVTSASLRHGRRGLHADECGTFLLALDAGQLHVDSAGYVTPLCAEPKRGQLPYALCCRDGDAVTVNLEYIIQLGAVAELASLGWSRERLRVELGEFDAACLGSDGRPEVLMEAKARIVGPDGLAALLRKWLLLGKAVSVARGENAANKYLELLRITEEQPEVDVLLVAAGARWWLTARRDGPYRLTFRTSRARGPT